MADAETKPKHWLTEWTERTAPYFMFMALVYFAVVSTILALAVASFTLPLVREIQVDVTSVMVGALLIVTLSFFLKNRRMF